jgi:hypothetical protein
LVVIAVAGHGNGAASASPDVVTYDGASATLAQSLWSGNRAWSGIYFLLDAQLPGAPGAYSVTVGTFEFAAAANVFEFSGIDQSNPIDAIGGGTGANCSSDDPSDSIDVASVNAWIVSSVAAFGSGAATPLSGQVLTYSTTVAGLGFVAGYRGPETSTGSRTIAWRMTSCNNSAHTLVALRPQ